MLRILIVIMALGLTMIFPGAALAEGPTAESNALAIDTIWVLLCACLVFLMHAGFTMLEAGFSRAKNTVNIMMKNLSTISLGAILFFLVGFAIAFGDSFAGFFGTRGFALAGIEDWDTGIPPHAFWFFQAVFACTAATIVSGAMAERTKFQAYLLFTVFVTALTYPVVAHWVWNGDGWLFNLGFIDFAGSTVVHSVGAWSALVGAWLVGARLGKYGKNGEVRALPGHSIAMGTLGTLLLWFGWFGFNGGSTLAGTNLSTGLIITNTMLAASAGVVATMLLTWLRYGKPDMAITLNGALAGLVGITAGAAALAPIGALLVGLVAGCILPLAVEFFDKVLKVDDPVGAISVHGVCGVLGTAAVGLLAVDGGLFYGGGAGLLGVQLIGIAAVLVWTLTLGFIVFKAIDLVVGLRVPAEEELEGLDLAEHGMEAYGDFILRPANVTGLGHLDGSVLTGASLPARKPEL